MSHRFNLNKSLYSLFIKISIERCSQEYIRWEQDKIQIKVWKPMSGLYGLKVKWELNEDFLCKGQDI